MSVGLILLNLYVRPSCFFKYTLLPDVTCVHPRQGIPLVIEINTYIIQFSLSLTSHVMLTVVHELRYMSKSVLFDFWSRFLRYSFTFQENEETALVDIPVRRPYALIFTQKVVCRQLGMAYICAVGQHDMMHEVKNRTSFF